MQEGKRNHGLPQGLAVISFYVVISDTKGQWKNVGKMRTSSKDGKCMTGVGAEVR